MIEFNPELYIFNDYYIKFKFREVEFDLSKIDINIRNYEWNKNKINFFIESDSWSVEYCLVVNNDGYKYNVIDGKEIEVITRSGKYVLSEWLEEFPPIITFDDGSKLENNLYINIQNFDIPVYSKENIMVYDWEKTNISIESQTHKRLSNSIQYKTIEEIKKEKFDIIFDDDGKGEIADIVAIKNDNDKILVRFYHCKYSKEEKPGSRLDDLYEVCGQAQRSVYWKMKIGKMFSKMMERNRAYINSYGVSRFIVGDEEKLKIYKNKLKIYDIQLEMYIVQPGVSKSKITEEMLKLLGSTQNWCQETYMIPLKMIANN